MQSEIMHEPEGIAADENDQIPGNAVPTFENLDIPMANGATTLSHQVTAKSMHQRFAENSGVRGTIFWDLFTTNDGDALKTKIKVLFPDMSMEVAEEMQILADETISREERREKINKFWKKAEVYNKKIVDTREMFFNIVWQQRKYSAGDLLAATIFVIATPNITDDSVRLHRALYSTEYTCHPVIRIRKCMVNNSSDDCCMIFVDENGRVYQNWTDYVENNTFHRSVLVVPKNGYYEFDNEDHVILECFRSPACSLLNNVLETTDTTTAVVGMASSTIPLAALFTPVAPVILIGAGIVAGAVGLWSIGRSTANLINRGRHEQSINVTDRQARASWLGVAGGAIGIGASGATHGLARYAASGHEVSALVQGAVNGINIASVTVNGVGVGNGVVDLILKAKDDENVSALDILQLSASLILFTHSIYNFRYASTIVESVQDGTINSFRKALSNRQRQIFNKMYKETIRIQGPKQGKTDIIRSLAKIPDKKYFNDIYRINRELNAKNIRQSFSGDETVLLNNDVNVETNILRNNIRQNNGDKYLQNIAQIPTSYTGNENSSLLNQIPFNANAAYRIAGIIRNIIQRYYVGSEANLENCVSFLFERLEEDALEYLMQTVHAFLLEFGEEIQRKLNRILPFELVLWDAFEISAKIRGTISQLNKSFLCENLNLIIDELRKFYQNTVVQSVNQIKCKNCVGFYQITQIT